MTKLFVNGVTSVYENRMSTCNTVFGYVMPPVTTIMLE